jgi:hypothetical protein
MGKDQWGNWNSLTEEEEIKVTSLILKHTKIIDPTIVMRIVDDNNKKQSYFKELLIKNRVKHHEIYLWDHSPIAFPGIRRHVGSKETSIFKKKKDSSKGKNALSLDDNSFPKMIWAFIMTGQKYSISNSPQKYSLAHIIDHKDYQNKRENDILNYIESKTPNFYAGMFTNVTNTVYIPRALFKPTDFDNKVRKVLIQLMDKYYGNICQILPNNQKLRLNEIEDKWNIEKFPQPTKVGNLDHVNNFIKFREDFYKGLE